MKRTKKLLIISLTISLVTIGIILYYTLSNGFLDQIDRINTNFLILAIISHFLGWLVWGYRIKLLSKTAKIKIKFLRCLEIVLSSLFAASITPSQAGGEPVRVYLLGREEGGSPGGASAVVLGGRALDFIFLVAAMGFSLILIGDIFLSEESFVSLEIVVLFLIMIIALVILLFYISLHRPEKIKKLVGIFEKPIRKIRPSLIKKIYKEIDNFNESLWLLIRGSKKHIFYGFLMTVIFWFLEFSIPYFLLLGLGYNVPYILAFAGYAIVMISLMIPISPGGAGVAEAVFYFVYNSIIKNLGGIGVLVLMWRFIAYYLTLLVGAFVSSKILHDLSTIEKEI